MRNFAVVKLLKSPNGLFYTIAYTTRICRNSTDKSDTGFYDMEFGPSDERMIRACIDAGHESIFEHVSFSFEILASRVTQQQVTRHRMASYMCESSRHVQPDKFDMVIPSSVFGTKTSSAYQDAVNKAWEAYETLIDHGVPIEDARYILPMGLGQPFIMTANLRQWRYMIKERGCKHAQWEIAQIFREVKRTLEKMSPVLVYGTNRCQTCGKKCK